MVNRYFLIIIFLFSSLSYAEEELKGTYFSSETETSQYNFGFYASLLGPEIGIAGQVDWYVNNYFKLDFRLGGNPREGTGVNDEMYLKAMYALSASYTHSFYQNNIVFLGTGIMLAEHNNEYDFLPFIFLGYEYTLDTGISFRLSAYVHLKQKYASGYEKILPFIPCLSIGIKL